MLSSNRPSMATVCCLCENIFQNPKVLPCLHTFCGMCLLNLVPAESLHVKELSCPTCGCSTTLPESGTAGFMNNAFANRLSEMYYKELKIIQEQRQGLGIEVDEGFNDHADDPAALINSPQMLTGIIPAISSAGHTGITDSGSKIYPDCGLITTSDSGSKTASDSGLKTSSDFRTITASDYRLKTASDCGLKTLSGRRSTSPESTEQTSESRDEVDMKSEACVISSKLAAKQMTLQGEALRLTYAIDSVNHSVVRWQESSLEIKSQIIDRSMILQHLIKKQEQKLLAKVDTQQHRTAFLDEVDSTKSELRANLKRVLHAIDFFKQVQSNGKDEDLIEMGHFLLGDLNIVSSVESEQNEYQLNLPTMLQMENLILENFGHLTSTSIKSTVYTPTRDGTEGSGNVSLTEDQKAQQTQFIKTKSRRFRGRRAKTQQVRLTSPQRREIMSASQRRSTQVVSQEDVLRAMEGVDLQDRQTILKQRRSDLLEKQKQDDAYQSIHDIRWYNVHQRQSRVNRRVKSFGGRSSSRSKLVEETTDVAPVNSNEDSGSNIVKADRKESQEDIAATLKYLRDNWRRRREILRSSESSGDPTDSPKSPANISISPHKFQEVFQDNCDNDSQQESPCQTFEGREVSKLPVTKHLGASFIADYGEQKIFVNQQSNVVSSESKGDSISNTYSSRVLPSSDRVSEREISTASFQDPLPSERLTTDVDDTRTVKSQPPATKGLTRYKLNQIRDNARRKRERWRSDPQLGQKTGSLG